MRLVTIIYCLRFETSLFVASYDSQDYGGSIRPRLHICCDLSRFYSDRVVDMSSYCSVTAFCRSTFLGNAYCCRRNAGGFVAVITLILSDEEDYERIGTHLLKLFPGFVLFLYVFH
jgi:hypothetical protein